MVLQKDLENLEAGRYSIKYRITGRGIGLIDVAILMAARRAQVQIWKLDKKLSQILEPREAFYSGLQLD